MSSFVSSKLAQFGYGIGRKRGREREREREREKEREGERDIVRDLRNALNPLIAHLNAYNFFFSMRNYAQLAFLCVQWKGNCNQWSIMVRNACFQVWKNLDSCITKGAHCNCARALFAY